MKVLQSALRRMMVSALMAMSLTLLPVATLAQTAPVTKGWVPLPAACKFVSTNTNLTQSGVVKLTNAARKKLANLPALKEDASLNAVAALRLQDMFDKNYFGHVSPQGMGPTDVAKDVGYEYLTFAENIAAGSFGTDQNLVNRWLKSTGHRKNILDRHFTHIGVAADKKVVDGRETWIAVQIFARPASDCPKPAASLMETMTAKKQQSDALWAQIVQNSKEFATLDQTTAEGLARANDLRAEQNRLTAERKALFTERNALIAEYNKQMAAFNKCVK